MEDYLDILINDTYSELKNIRSEINMTDTSEMMRFSIIAIEIALSLFQLGVYNKREINSFEENWFKGGYHIHYNLEGGWKKLADNYSKIVEIVKDRDYFRSN